MKILLCIVIVSLGLLSTAVAIERVDVDNKRESSANDNADEPRSSRSQNDGEEGSRNNREDGSRRGNQIGGNDGHDAHVSAKTSYDGIQDLCQICSCKANDDESGGKVVDCSWRNLATANFETLTLPDKCVSINLSGNNFGDDTLPSDIFQSNADTLTEINLSVTQLTWLPGDIFYNLVALQKLDLSYNQLTDFEPGTFGDLQGLQELNLDFNQLTAIKGNYLFPVGGYSLKVLSAQQNLISKVDPDLLLTSVKLETLKLAANRITSLDVDLLEPASETLTTLDLSNNYISLLPQYFFQGMQALADIDLSNNDLKHLSSPSVLSPLSSSLRKVNLSSNTLEEIAKDTFTGFSVIEAVSLADNMLTVIEKNLWGLVTPAVGADSDWNTVKNLDLRNNQFRHFDEDVVASIMPLYQKNGKLSVIQLSGNPWQCDSRMAFIKQYGTTAAELFDSLAVNIVCQGPGDAAGITLAKWQPATWDEAPTISANIETESKIQNYRELFGNCPGNVIGNVTFGQLEECSAECRRESSCVGFTFTPNEGTCLMKSKSCGVPFASSSNRFFESTKIARLDSRVTTTPSADFTRPKRTRPARQTRSTTTPSVTTTGEDGGANQESTLLTRKPRVRPTRPTTTVPTTKPGDVDTTPLSTPDFERLKTLFREFTTPKKPVPVVVANTVQSTPSSRPTETTTTTTKAPTTTTTTARRVETEKSKQTDTTKATTPSTTTPQTTSRPTEPPKTSTTSKLIETQKTTIEASTTKKLAETQKTVAPMITSTMAKQTEPAKTAASTTPTTTQSTTTTTTKPVQTKATEPSKTTPTPPTTATTTTKAPTTTVTTATKPPVTTTTTTTAATTTTTTTVATTTTASTTPTRPTTTTTTIPTTPTTTAPTLPTPKTQVTVRPAARTTPVTVPLRIGGGGVVPVNVFGGSSAVPVTQPRQVTAGRTGLQPGQTGYHPSDRSGEAADTRATETTTQATTPTPATVIVFTPSTRKAGSDDGERGGGPLLAALVGLARKGNNTRVGGIGNDIGVYPTPMIIITSTLTTPRPTTPTSTTTTTARTQTTSCWWCLPTTKTTPDRPRPSTTTINPRNIFTQPPMPTPYHWERPTQATTTGAPTPDPNSEDAQINYILDLAAGRITSTTHNYMSGGGYIGGYNAMYPNPGSYNIQQPGEILQPATAMWAAYTTPTKPRRVITDRSGNWIDARLAALWNTTLRTEPITSTTTTTTMTPYLGGAMPPEVTLLPTMPPPVVEFGQYISPEELEKMMHPDEDYSTSPADPNSNATIATRPPRTFPTRPTTTPNAVLIAAISKARARLDLGSITTVAVPDRDSIKPCSAAPLVSSYMARRISFDMTTAYYSCEVSPLFGGNVQQVDQRPAPVVDIRSQVGARPVVEEIPQGPARAVEDSARQAAIVSTTLAKPSQAGATATRAASTVDDRRRPTSRAPPTRPGGNGNAFGTTNRAAQSVTTSTVVPRRAKRQANNNVPSMMGPTGFAMPGYPGMMGPTGYTGMASPNSYPGMMGSTGYTGMASPNSYPGTMGSTGYTGMASPNSYPGMMGPTGNSDMSANPGMAMAPTGMPAGSSNNMMYQSMYNNSGPSNDSASYPSMGATGYFGMSMSQSNMGQSGGPTGYVIQGSSSGLQPGGTNPSYNNNVPSLPQIVVIGEPKRGPNGEPLSGSSQINYAIQAPPNNMPSYSPYSGMNYGMGSQGVVSGSRTQSSTMTCSTSGQWIGAINCAPTPDQVRTATSLSQKPPALDVFVYCIDTSSPQPTYYKTTSDAAGNVMFKLPPSSTTSCYITFLSFTKGKTVNLKMTDFALNNNDKCEMAAVTAYGQSESVFYGDRSNMNFNKIKQICNSTIPGATTIELDYFGWIEYTSSSTSATGATLVFSPVATTTKS